ncbi:MDIS1-interacting receptor like kinase 2-like [Telopea speciosissima]|uniref:MDIS1-interacting receptor like kinase 2-like n=1 Tax=Telopea speciosissima TaxID=54955 RepID=UPI001CC50E7D|nr:MDIS1-interacting receptor like kinase 2-like [Telopea speciosissima]
MEQLEKLNLNHNKLHGSIPEQLEKLNFHNFWQDMDFSYNDLEGVVPDKIAYESLHGVLWMNNKGFVQAKSINSITDTRTPKNGDLFSIWNFDGTIAYSDIVEATEEFDIKYCIGTGSCGSVYVKMLPTGKVVAVKKFHRREIEEKIYEKSFRNEIHVLTTIRNRNIVKLYGFCSHQMSIFSVYEYIDGGSLAYVFENETEAVELDWSKRLNVIKGVAQALSYLHHDCVPPIIQRDISSNNILLDEDFEPHVSDFGAAKFLNPNSSNRTTCVGTYGYITPAKEIQVSFGCKRYLFLHQRKK